MNLLSSILYFLSPLPLGALLSLIRAQSDAREGRKWGSMSDTSSSPSSSSSSPSNPLGSGTGRNGGGNGNSAAHDGGNSGVSGSGSDGGNTIIHDPFSVVQQAYLDETDVEHTLSLLLEALYVHKASSGSPTPPIITRGPVPHINPIWSQRMRILRTRLHAIEGDNLCVYLLVFLCCYTIHLYRQSLHPYRRHHYGILLIPHATFSLICNLESFMSRFLVLLLAFYHHFPYHLHTHIVGRVFDMFGEYTKRAIGYGEILGPRGGINLTSIRAFFEEGGSPRVHRPQKKEEERKVSTTGYLSDITNNRYS